jgi:hypothetical protein
LALGEGNRIAPASAGQIKKGSNMGYKVRLVLAGLTALLAVSAIISVSASAGPGPFWLQKKANDCCSAGWKITAQSPEKFQGKSGRAVLKSKILAIAVEIICNKDRSGGIIYNNGLQGQIKIAVSFSECTINGLPKCKVNEPIQFNANGHLMWKWNGTTAQLNERPQEKQVPDLLFYGGEIQQGTKSLEESKPFVSIAIGGEGCAVKEAEPFVAKGYESADVTPWKMQFENQMGPQTEFVDRLFVGFTPGPHEQHFWNGQEQVGLVTSLHLGTEAAKFENQAELGPFYTQKNEQQIIAISER